MFIALDERRKFRGFCRGTAGHKRCHLGRRERMIGVPPHFSFVVHIQRQRRCATGPRVVLPHGGTALGCLFQIITNPEWGCALIHGSVRRNPFRVHGGMGLLTQGRRSFLAPTLGSVTERRWRSMQSLISMFTTLTFLESRSGFSTSPALATSCPSPARPRRTRLPGDPIATIRGGPSMDCPATHSVRLAIQS